MIPGSILPQLACSHLAAHREHTTQIRVTNAFTPTAHIAEGHLVVGLKVVMKQPTHVHTSTPVTVGLMITGRMTLPIMVRELKQDYAETLDALPEAFTHGAAAAHNKYKALRMRPVPAR